MAQGYEPQTVHALFNGVDQNGISVAATSISSCGPCCCLAGNFKKFKDRVAVSCKKGALHGFDYDKI